MASSPSPSPFLLNIISPSSTTATTTTFTYPLSLSLYFLSQAHYSKFRIFCNNQTIQIETHQINPIKKKQRKPRPSFSDQVREKWSVKPTSFRDQLPWQNEEKRQHLRNLNEFEEEEDDNESSIDNNSSVSDSVRFDSVKSVKVAARVQETKPKKQNFAFDDRNPQKDSGSGKIDDEFVLSESRMGINSVKSDSVSFGSVRSINFAPWVQEAKPRKQKLDFDDRNQQKDGDIVISNSRIRNKSLVSDSVNFDYSDGNIEKDDEIQNGFVEGKEEFQIQIDERESTIDEESQNVEKMPWVRGDRSRSNTELAEKLIPDVELKRLRNKAMRMVERFRVGTGGITQELVDSIHEKWKGDEVVKLKFKGLSALNMKRVHESLESRTGGLVIWRSGSSIVLFRGMAYDLPCVKSFTKQNSKDIENDSSERPQSSKNYQRQDMKDLSEEELQDLKELNLVLDGLGPRFVDWSGRDPLPIDADLLPSIVEGYKRPFRLLPYGVKPGLLDKETTFYRRTARTMPPHFALGRNRELQGLAVAMVKLWERSAIAKIAIKRGVHNTSNERMAEELKRLTGGTLLSRNKDFIVFYRGNDFLPPRVTKTLTEAHKIRTIQQEEEDKAREKASTLFDSTPKNVIKGPLVAGTLAETMAATSRWGTEPNSIDIEKMKRDSAVARHASLVRFLEKKLVLGKGKIKKAEKALAKVQEYLEPSPLPTDLETLTDEERFTLRKMGLSMKPYLVLGRRGIFDGTVENMHLHWKYRELVKIMVERKSFAQVKHVAISLEAESGGVLVSVDRTTKGYAIIVYRGKNYQRPKAVRPNNLLTRRQALARSIELQRREALKHHISELQERIEKLKSELEDMKIIDEIDEETLHSRVEDDSDSDDDHDHDDDEMTENEDEEAYLQVYEDGDRTR